MISTTRCGASRERYRGSTTKSVQSFKVSYTCISRICPQPFTRLGVKETGVAIQQVVNQVSDLNRSWSSNLITADHETLTSLTGNELRKDLRKWIAPPDPSVNYNAASSAHHEGTAAWCTNGNTVADWKTSAPCYGFTGRVFSGALSPAELHPIELI